MIGTAELILAASSLAGTRLVPRLQPWLKPVLICLVVAMVLTPPDPATLLMAAVPLITAFVAGVRFAPYLPSTRETP